MSTKISNRKFWLVWSEAGRVPTVKHWSKASAEKEAERLAKTHQGYFHVLGLVGTCSATGVEWMTRPVSKRKNEEATNIPF